MILLPSKKSALRNIFKGRSVLPEKLCDEFGIPRSTAYRWVRTHQQWCLKNPNGVAFPLPAIGRPKAIRPELKIKVIRAIRNIATERELRWAASCHGKKGHPKTRKPRLTCSEIHQVVQDKGFVMSKSTIGRLLKEMRLKTAGQYRHRRKRT